MTRSPVRPVFGALVALLALLLAATPAWAAADPARDRQWGLTKIGAPSAWSSTPAGDGITIAIVDSGVDLAHEDLAANIVGGLDVIDGDRMAQDEFGHGTHVAGIAAAVADNGRGVAGVAPRASIMPVRVLDEDGSGSTGGVDQGIRWAADNGADVINLSLGRTAQQLVGSGIVDAIEYAWSKGVVVVVAAGNDYVLSSGFGDVPALVVSATTVDDREPDYSSGVGSARWGISAPGGGCSLLTCPREDDVFATYWEPDSSDVYAYLRGTSMAAPHVAGAAAVLLSAGLGPGQTVQRLLDTARDIGASGRDSTFGEGRLDLAAAVKGLSAGGTTPTRDAAPSPATPKPAGTTSSGGAGSTTPSSSSDDSSTSGGADTATSESPSSAEGGATTDASTTDGAATDDGSAPASFDDAPPATTTPPTSSPGTGIDDDGAVSDGQPDGEAVAAGTAAEDAGEGPGALGLVALLLLAGAAAGTVVARRRDTDRPG